MPHRSGTSTHDTTQIRHKHSACHRAGTLHNHTSAGRRSPVHLLEHGQAVSLNISLGARPSCSVMNAGKFQRFMFGASQPTYTIELLLLPGGSFAAGSAESTGMPGRAACTLSEYAAGLTSQRCPQCGQYSTGRRKSISPCRLQSVPTDHSPVPSH